MMILKAYETNNGYRCGCCSSGYSDYEWIPEETMPSFDALLNMAYDFNNNIDGIIELRYEKDGVVLYGYETSFTKRTTEVFVVFGEERHRIVADGMDKEIVSREDIIDIYKNR